VFYDDFKKFITLSSWIKWKLARDLLGDYKMPQCIYSLKHYDDFEFSSQEHVIPACIGGINKLPKGYVSDEVNKMFSGLELHFARESHISLARMLFGPGKRGSLNPKKATTSKIVIMENESDKEKQLGFVKLGKPFSISQIHFFDDSESSKKISFSLGHSSEKPIPELLEDFWKRMDTYDGSAITIREHSFKKKECILGFYKNKWYFAINNNLNEEEAKHFSAEFVGKILEARKKGKLNISDKYINKSNQVTMHSGISYRTSDLRIIAKTAFNCLAYIKGSDFVLNETFNSIRNAIYSGKNIEEYVRMIGEQGFLSEILKSPYASKFGSNFHIITISQHLTMLIATICFYGLNPTFIVLTDELYENYNDIDGIVCDWKNQKEIKLIDFISTICGH